MMPISAQSQKLLLSQKGSARRISPTPFKRLNAPELQDNFYLNLLDWSVKNLVAVGLESCVYLWDAGKVFHSFFFYSFVHR